MPATPNTAPPAAPSADTLTVWEAKERAGLLALETDGWRERRLIAEDPNTTAEGLARLIGEVEAIVVNTPYTPKDPFQLTANALSVHPNTSPEQILKHYWLAVGTPLCHNPIAPFLCLEVPDFWGRLPERASARLLADEALPYSASLAFTHHPNEQISQEARLHVSLTGEISSRGEGLSKVTDYWREFCRNPKPHRSLGGMKYSRIGERDAILEWHYELVRLGFAPTWAAPSEPFQRQHVLRKSLCNPVFHLLLGMTLWDIFTRQGRISFREFVRQLILEAIDCRDAGLFAEFVALLHGVYKPGIQWCIERENWWDRLRAALSLPLSDQPFKSDDWSRSPLDLLHHLARDGNRLVRWAAQTRLADPDFTFTWHEGNE